MVMLDHFILFFIIYKKIKIIIYFDLTYNIWTKKFVNFYFLVFIRNYFSAWGKSCQIFVLIFFCFISFYNLNRFFFESFLLISRNKTLRLIWPKMNTKKPDLPKLKSGAMKKAVLSKSALCAFNIVPWGSKLLFCFNVLYTLLH